MLNINERSERILIQWTLETELRSKSVKIVIK